MEDWWEFLKDIFHLQVWSLVLSSVTRGPWERGVGSDCGRGETKFHGPTSAADDTVVTFHRPPASRTPGSPPLLWDGEALSPPTPSVSWRQM